MSDLQFVPVLGKKIAYQWFNKAADHDSCLVFLHDSLGSIAQWRDFPEQLGKRLNMPVLVYERHGYGASETLHEHRETDYLQYEGSVILRALLDALQLTKNVILVGHSDGGSIALVFASLYPDYVKAVVPIAAQVLVEDVTIQGIQETVEVAKTTPLIAQLSKYHGDRTNAVFNAWWTTWLSARYWHWNIVSYMPEIVAPVLVIRGALDNYGTRKQVDSVAGNCGGTVAVSMIPNCGHAPYKEFPTLVLDVIFGWMELSVLGLEG
jgi:pimeloyl-ACP methyl ester carboxylesterase